MLEGTYYNTLQAFFENDKFKKIIDIILLGFLFFLEEER